MNEAHVVETVNSVSLCMRCVFKLDRTLASGLMAAVQAELARAINGCEGEAHELGTEDLANLPWQGNKNIKTCHGTWDIMIAGMGERLDESTIASMLERKML